MSEARALQERYDAHAASFLLPLLEGGEVVLGRPLSPGMLEHFALARPSDGVIELGILDRLHAHAHAVAPLRVLPWPERGLMALSMAAHDLLVLTDPLLDRFLARTARGSIAQWVRWLTEAAGAPRTRGEALCRHAVVSRMLELRRPDAVASNWGFTHRYLGRALPQGVLTKPRWVEVTRRELGLLDLVESQPPALGARALLEELVRASPVTSLLSLQAFPDLVLGGAALAVLSDDHVRNGVARELAAAGDRIAEPVGRALRALAAARPPPHALYQAIALVYEALVIAALDGSAGEGPSFGALSSPDARLFYAVLPAILGAPDDLSAMLELDDRDLVVLRRHAARLDEAAGPEQSALAVGLVDWAEPAPSAGAPNSSTAHEVADA